MKELFALRPIGAICNWRFRRHTDVLIPDVRVVADVVSEEPCALGGMEFDDFNVKFAQPVDAATEVLGFTNDDGSKPELADESTAIPAGRKRGDHDEVAVGSLAPSMAEGIGLAVDGWIVLLNTAIVSDADELAAGVENGGADRDSALREA